MILNLLRVEALRVEEMIKRSFSENASQRLLPEQQKQVIEVNLLFFYLFCPDRFFFQSEKFLSSLPDLDCAVCHADIDLFYDESLKIVEENQKLLGIALDQSSRTLGPGRVVILRDGVCHFSSPSKANTQHRNSISTTTSPSF